MASLNNYPWSQHRALTPVGKLRTYVSLPAFSYTPNWVGVSELVVQYNFSASQNFYLKNRPAKPSGVNYVLCIKYRVGDVVYRYKLWTHESATGLDEVPLYTSQVIKANFVLEVWSTRATASQATAINIITSVVQVPTDISNLSDVALAVGTAFNSFNDVQAAATLPATIINASGYYHFKSSGINSVGGGVCSSWTNDGSLQVASDDLVPLGPNPDIVAGPNGLNAVQYPNMRCNLTATSSYAAFIVCKLKAWNSLAELFTFFSNSVNSLGAVVCSSVVNPAIKGKLADNVPNTVFTTDQAEIVINDWNLIRFRVDVSVKKAYLSINGSSEIVTAAVPGTLDSINRLQFDTGSNTLTLAEAIIYDSAGDTNYQADMQQVEAYLLQKLALGMPFPVSFAQTNNGAAWLDNN